MAKITYTPEELQFIASLKQGECGAVNVKRINAAKQTPNDKLFSVELAEKLTAGRGFNVLAAMNPNNDAFNVGGPRRQWLNCDAAMCTKVFGVNPTQLDALQLGIGRENVLMKNPSVTGIDGVERFLKLQIRARLQSQLAPTAWELKPENYQNAKKTAGSGGRDIKGVNKETGEIEQIFEQIIVNTATKDNAGNIVNENNWEHQTIEEYVSTNEMGTPPTATAKIDFETGQVESASQLASLD